MSTQVKDTTFSNVESVSRLFQQVHKSAAHSQRYKRELLDFEDGGESNGIDSICSVVLLILKQVPQLTADVLKRHFAFLTELSKTYREKYGSDKLTISILRCVLPFHNANDKSVRAAVVATFDALLRTVDQSNTSEERQDFYQESAEMLKLRIHDKFAPVREKAVASIAVFQTGKKDCDVTQQLVALLCNDPNADVRRQILHCIPARKEFLEGYFHGMVRCTQDVVSRVRAESWDALSRFPWRYITAYAQAKNLDLAELLFQGLTDATNSVVIACRASLTNCWLHRDGKDDYAAFLDPIDVGFTISNLAHFDKICREILHFCKKKKHDFHVPLDTESFSTSLVLMWKSDCSLSMDSDDGDDTVLLPPLDRFAAILQDTIYCYARPDAEAKVVKFRNADDADNILRILLSSFSIYDENGYLSHVDNTTRNALLKLLHFLLKVVPDDDPSLFVDAAVRCIKNLTERTPEETTKTVTSALDSLFKSLRLPQKYALGFDDVEALVRKGKERQQELIKLKVQVRTGESTQEAYEELKEEILRDEKFLLRIQLIVLAFLSNSQRGDSIPPFCTHVFHLGRLQNNVKVRVAATRSLGLLCLINPESVHTFMPLLLSDATSGEENAEVAAAAVGVCFDLVLEYGLKFFDTTTSDRVEFNSENAFEARLQKEKEIGEEDVHKVGSKKLLSVFFELLHSTSFDIFATVIQGFCKLLSSNRVQSTIIHEVLARLLLFFVHFQMNKKDNLQNSYMTDYLLFFFRSYTSSHPQRQADFAKAGIVALHFALSRNPLFAQKLIEMVTRLSDAFLLSVVRDVDPDSVGKVNNPTADEKEAEEEGMQLRTAVATSSLQSARLLRELSKYSLHETIAEGILCEIAVGLSPDGLKVCLDALETRMYFYAKEPRPFLFYCATKAVETVQDEASKTRLQAFLTHIGRRYSNFTLASTADNDLPSEWSAYVANLEKCDSVFEEELGALIPEKVEPSSGGQTATKKRVKREDDFLDVESIVGPHKRSRH
ncbi:Nuclear condensing complex subunits, C-term domain containing protein, putative [Angomonas deanei]|uniref:Nuclear condensing complex subunits, C-term domain containing protein, putative n=1 Tax=Angomonas deanei TaxID=59799 RepID=A0A7G2CFU6_9TRYP|nr:Nuclear condensing complex subunits, C-term domain containing protein, putative [Angomonas deanei]